MTAQALWRADAAEGLRFQSGGTLKEGALYVKRPADDELFDVLLRGEFCYVLAPRQIGKSSLRVRTARRLREKDVRCATIDLTRIGGKESTPETWYFGMVQELCSRLGLPDDPADFWHKHANMTVVHRFVVYLRQQVLAQVPGRIVIFLDEIDTVLALPFSADDFFAAVRDVFNSRADDPAYERVTFCLLGVAAPGDLIQDTARTPFNIGRGVHLEDFTCAEAESFLPGLVHLSPSPRRLLGAVLSFTHGHPYMTQKVCELLARRGPAPDESEEQRVEKVVTEGFLRRGRGEDPNLEYAERRLCSDGQVAQMLRLYRRLLDHEKVAVDHDDPVQMGLRLTGMAAERRAPVPGDGPDQGPGPQEWLEVRNRIFAHVFDPAWVKEKETGRLLAGPLLCWLDGGKKDDSVLRGQALKEAEEWARGRRDLAPEESEFLLAGLQVARREERAAARARARRDAIRMLSLAVVLLTMLLCLALWEVRRAERAEARARAARREAEIGALAERGDKAALLAQQPGREHQALLSALQAIGPSLRVHEDPVPAALAGLTAAVMAARPSRPLRGHITEVFVTSFSPDGRRVLTASFDGTARLWDADSGAELAVMRGHTTLLTSAKFSPDGSHVVTTSADHTARIWDGMTGKPLVLLQGHQDQVLYASFSPDGRRVVTAGADLSARIWNADSGEQLTLLRGHQSEVMVALFSPDGTRIATSSRDGTARVWDAASGKELLVLGTKHPTLLSYSPDGTRLLASCLDATARVWDAESGEELLLLRGHGDRLRSVEFSPDGRRILTASMDHTARIWDATSGKELHVLRGHTSWVIVARFSGDGKLVLTASADNTARVWEAESGNELLILRGHSAALIAGAFSPDGRHAITGAQDATARLWNLCEHDEVITLRGHANMIRNASFSPDGRRVVTGSNDSTARVWDAQTGEQLFTLHNSWNVFDVNFSPDGSRVLTSDGESAARVWDARTGAEIFSVRGRTHLTRFAGFSPDGQLIVTGTADNGALVLDANTGREVAVLSGHGAVLISATFSPDSKRVVTASLDHTARVWDTRTGRLLLTLSGHADEVLCASFSPDGSRILTCSTDRTARLWATDTGQELFTLRGHTDQIWVGKFSPDGSRAITAGVDHTARLWDTRTGTLLSVLRVHTAEVVGASFSSDGSRVVTAGYDHTARVWDVRTGQEVLPFIGHSDRVFTAEFSPDGQHVITASGDRTAMIFPVSVKSFVTMACQRLQPEPEFAQVREACVPYL